MMGMGEVGELVKGKDNVNVSLKIFIKYHGIHGIRSTLGFSHPTIVHYKPELECLNNFFYMLFSWLVLNCSALLIDGRYSSFSYIKIKLFLSAYLYALAVSPVA